MKKRIKLLAIGDTHITGATPKNRVDDYPATQFKKFEWILSFAKKNNCEAILQPGDLFDSFKCSDSIKIKYIELFKKFEIAILTVPGQHDLRHHNSMIDNTPLGVLNASGSVFVVKGGILLAGDGDLIVKGAGWEQDIPKPNDYGVNILLTHRMVIKRNKLWKEQKDYVTSASLLNKHNYDLIISGDNHNSFDDKWNMHNEYDEHDRYLINAGSLMRSTSAQIKHKPCVYLIKIEIEISRKPFIIIEKHLIPIDPIENIMRIDDIEAEKEKDEKLKTFVENLKTSCSVSEEGIEGIDFVNNVNQYVKENQIKKPVRKALQEIIENVRK